MILYTELMAWIIRASLFSFWLTGLFMDGLLDYHTKGLINGVVQKYILFILAGIAANFILNGFPRLRKEEIRDELIFAGEFKASLLGTISFLLQGAKDESVIRNMVNLTKKKHVFITKDGAKLIIINSDTPKKTDHIISKIHLSLSLILLFSSPALMVFIFNIAKYLLILASITPIITGAVIKTLTLIVFTYYFFPYFYLSKQYSISVIRYVSKPLGDYFGYPTFSTPLLEFGTSKNTLRLGAADPRKVIYLNTEYIGNNIDLFNYVVAHEAGHLNDKYINFFKVILAPILNPWLAFILISSGVCLSAIGNASLGNTIKIIGISTIILAVYTSLDINRLGEFRADEYAVRKLGIAHVKRNLQELSLKHMDENISLLGTVPFSKRLERIMSKKWEK